MGIGVQHSLSKTEQNRKIRLIMLEQALRRMGNPQDRLRFVHIAGTNGKGSTSAMLASVLKQAGYITGLFISPHIKEANERIQVNFQPIEKKDWDALDDIVQTIYLELGRIPTVYERLVAIAFLHFQRCSCDIVVLETGIGGENDVTNAITTTEVAVFTNIGLDHTPSLGATIEEIARNKSGIIKQNCDVVLYPNSPNISAIIEDACHEKKAFFHTADFSQIRLRSSSLDGQTFDYHTWKHLAIPLLGDHQLLNAAVVLEVIQALQNRGWNMISYGSVVEGLNKVRWPCRLEIVHHNPVVILDVVTNSLGAAKFKEAIQKYFFDKPLVLVLGCLNYKQYNDMFDILLSIAHSVVAVTATGAQGLSAFTLAKKITGKSTKIYACESITDGLEMALQLTGKDGIVAAAGTFHIMAGIKDYCMSPVSFESAELLNVK